LFKKIFILFALLLVSNSAFAIDKKDLNVDFFADFNDDNLVYYINQAIENNHTSKQATYRVEQYRQMVKYSFSKELPSFSVSANYLGVKIPELDNFTLSKNAFVLPFVANYEADFLLKNRDKTKSQKKSYEASKCEEKAIYIALLSDVATVYVNILEYDELIKLAKEQVSISQKILDYDKQKFDRGVINSTQYNISKKNFESAKIKLENLQKQQEVLLMQLVALTDSHVQEKELKRGTLDNFEYKKTIPSDVESDVIFSRPDIMSAEAKLEKAKIDIRVARKEFLPTFNITGLWMFNTLTNGTFFSWQSSLAAILAGASQDIFTGGRKIANLKIQKAKFEELFENYKQTSIEAVKEVNTALCFTKHDLEIEKDAQAKLNYEYQNLQSAKSELKQGTIAQPKYLSELSNVINLQNEVASSKTQRLVNYFTLYKAVGGKL